MFFTNFGNAINFRGIWDKIKWFGEAPALPRPKIYHKYAKKLNILELLYPDLYPKQEEEEEPNEPVVEPDEPTDPDTPQEPENPQDPDPVPNPEELEEP